MLLRHARRWQSAGRSRISIACASSAVASLLLSAGVASAATYTYTPAEVTNTSGTSDGWVAGTGWTPSAPVSATDTTLILNGPTTNGITRFTTNDIAGLFQLNNLTIQGAGPATTASALTVSGNGLDFRTDVATLPVINLNATKGAATYTFTVNNPITLTNSTTIQGNGTAAFVLAGAIGGAGGVTKTGTSAVQFNSAANNYGGATLVQAGTLRLGVANVIPDGSAVTVTNSGVNSGILDFNTKAETLASLTISGTGLINNTAAAITITGALNNTSTSAGGSGAAYVINGGGVHNINGLASFGVGATSLISGTAGSQLKLNGGISTTGAAIKLNTGTSKIVLNSDWTVNDPGTIAFSAITNSGTNTNQLDLFGGNRTFTVADGSAAVDFAVNATITSSVGTGTLIKAGPGTMSLANNNAAVAANSYNGGTSILAGTLAILSNGSLGTGNVGITPGATLDLSAVAVTSGGIADSATLTLSHLDTTYGRVVFGSNALNEVVGSLIVDGETKPAGTYTAAELPNFITGSGSLTVVPEPGAIGSLAGALGVLCARRRRKA